MAKKNIDELFLNILNSLKDNKLNEDMYNFILNSYDVDKEYFNSNIIFKYNRELFYSIYINFKITCDSFNYSDYYDKLNDVSLIYFDKLDEQFNSKVLYNMSNLFFVIEKEDNDKDSYNSKNILYSIRAIFNNRSYLSNVLEYILIANNIESLTNSLLELRVNMSEDEVYNIFYYIICNIENDKFDLEEFITKVKQNNYIYLEDYEFFNDFNNNHKNILNSVNSNIDLYQQLLEKLTSIEDKYKTSLYNIDSYLSNLVKKIKR